MICNCDSYVCYAINSNNVAFRARVVDGHILRCTRGNAGLFDGSTRPNNDFTPNLKRFYPCTLIGFDCTLIATDIRPVVCSKLANGQSVDKYVRLLSQIEDRDGAARTR